ncbi:MAG: hypothetical protein ABI435_05165 [Pseudolysinimonas sp.]
MANGRRPPLLEGSMRHILVLQWQASLETDFEDLVKMEEELESSLSEYAIVDGHDIGSDEMNIFIETDQPARAFAEVDSILNHWPRWTDVRAAFRAASGGNYAVLWPSGLTHFEVK